MKLLVVNADDYGLAVGVNAGVIEGYRHGIITSTTIMANGQALADGVSRLQESPDLGVGCHLVLLGGEPVAKAAQVRSLIDTTGRFPATLTAFLARFAAGWVKPVEIITEFRAQLDRLLGLGLTISHCDSHKHAHAHPAVLDALIQVAEEYKIRYIRNPFEHCVFAVRQQLSREMRRAFYKRYLLGKLLGYYRMIFRMRIRETFLRCPDHFYGFLLTGHLQPEVMLQILAQMPEGLSELMCHPARLEPDLLNCATRLKASRERELAAVTASSTRQAIDALGIQLTSFRALAQQYK
ncbi:MAG: ChbG/HpnK family deacetylase [Acidobacteriota bacterium]